MAVTKVEQNSVAAPATFTYAGTGWTGGNAGNQVLADVGASGGTYGFTTHATDTVTIGVSSGYTGALLLCTSRSDNGTAVPVSLDGVAQPVWVQGNGSASNDLRYNWYQSLYPPIRFASGSTHSIVVTAQGTFSTIDGIELFDTATTVTPRTIVFVGHSQIYGFQENVTPTATPVSPNIPTALISLMGAGWTGYNQCVPGEDLTNGGNTGYQTPFYNNSYSPDPGWYRYSTAGGTLSTWAGGAFTQDTRVATNGVGVWHNVKPEVVVIMHGVNDLGFTVLYDAPSNGNTSNGASALQQIQALHPPAALTAGTFAITQGGTSTALISFNTDVATVNARLTAASLPFTASGAAGSPLSSNTNITLTANGYIAQTALTLTSNTTTSASGALTITTSQTGRNVIPAGAGWALLRFKQRLREMIWRMNLASPNTIIMVCGIMANYIQYGYDPANPALGSYLPLLYDAAIRDVCNETTIRNAYYVPVWSVPFTAGGNVPNNFYIFQQNAFPAGGATDLRGGHLTPEGCSFMAAAIYHKLMEVKNRTGMGIGSIR